MMCSGKRRKGKRRGEGKGKGKRKGDPRSFLRCGVVRLLLGSLCGGRARKEGPPDECNQTSFMPAV
jgi:hypothetical protein